MKRHLLVTLAIACVLTACHDEDRSAEAPKPQEVTDSAIGQFCGMALVEHPGPKGQIFVRGDTKPFWFATVRDAVAFTMLPEMPKNVAAIYVTDMARAHDWNRPEPDTWVEAHQALFVIDSTRKSGMETNEAIPFSDPDAAHRFTAANGGKIVRFADIPQSYVLASNDDAVRGTGVQDDAIQGNASRREMAFQPNARQREARQVDAYQDTLPQQDMIKRGPPEGDPSTGTAPTGSKPIGTTPTASKPTGTTP